MATAEPDVLLAVRVNVVVEYGKISTLPAAATVPILGLMVTVYALLTFQASIEVSPAVTLPGLAAKELIMGKPPYEGEGDAAETTT